MKKLLAFLLALISSVATAQQPNAFKLIHTADLRSALVEWQNESNGIDSPSTEAGAAATIYAHEAFGYVTGISQMLGDSKAACFPPPPKGSMRQSIAIVIKYMDAHPEQWQYNSQGIVTAALSEAFPCLKK